jgi:protein-tyrosine phosphatase
VKFLERFLNLESGVNFRELGGYQTLDGHTTKWHKALRCGSMSYLSTSDLRKLAEYGLSCVVDLRSESERNYGPDKLPEGTRHVLASVYPLEHSLLEDVGIAKYSALSKNGLGFAEETYVKMLVDPHAREAYGKMFQALVENDEEGKSLAFHCVAGKDRTGIGAFLFLGLLGVKRQTVLEDFMLTNLAFSEKTAKEQNAIVQNAQGDELAERLNSYLGVRKEHFLILEKTVEILSGSVRDFCFEYLNVSKDDYEKMRLNYLE